ncbi:Fe2+ transport system protein B [Desulfitispora alkaliphila]|uniref:hypothetical protein n=1 Tax=Desulfitispora alkaliphila TaxID=622674 RepID=UPI003D19BA53
MSLKSLDMQVLLPKSQEVANRQQSERQAVPNQQHNMAAETEKKRLEKKNRAEKNERISEKKVKGREEPNSRGKNKKKGQQGSGKKGENVDLTV